MVTVPSKSSKLPASMLSGHSQRSTWLPASGSGSHPLATPKAFQPCLYQSAGMKSLGMGSVVFICVAIYTSALCWKTGGC